MNKVWLPTVVIGTLLFFNQAQARIDWATEVKHAQAALNAGQYDKAYAEYLRLAEEQNNPLAQFALALFYQNGWGRAEDPVAACKWHEKAAAGDIPAAAHFYAKCLAEGVGRSPDPAKATVWYDKAAALGHHMSLCSRAELYITGNGVPKDPAKGLALCRQVAERGVVAAQTQMGRFLLEGDESIRNFDESFAWFEMAAQRNSMQAQYYLGLMLRDGIGRPVSFEDARNWFELAASQGYAPAYLPTGELYFNAPVDPQTGKLSAHDLAKAYLWLSASAKRSKNPEDASRSLALLKKVIKIMPHTWLPALDAKVAEHLAKYPPLS
jgi:TPR repeat protein